MSYKNEKSIMITDCDLINMIFHKSLSNEEKLFDTQNIQNIEETEVEPAEEPAKELAEEPAEETAKELAEEPAEELEEDIEGNINEVGEEENNNSFLYLKPVICESKRVSFSNKDLNTILPNHKIKKEYESTLVFNNFVFIIPAYNSAKWVQKIFDSIRNQFYSKKYYRVIYINDKSDDNTIKEIEFYQKNHPEFQIHLINNEERQWPAYSRYTACQLCMDDEICVFLDGDDWLVNNSTLNILNKVYQNPIIQCTFGSMKKCSLAV